MTSQHQTRNRPMPEYDKNWHAAKSGDLYLKAGMPKNHENDTKRSTTISCTLCRKPESESRPARKAAGPTPRPGLKITAKPTGRSRPPPDGSHGDRDPDRGLPAEDRRKPSRLPADQTGH